MPELPEVENVVRTLQPAVGQRVERCTLSHVAPLVHCKPSQVQSELTGKQITTITRRAKYIVIHLEEQPRFIVHLGMSGQLRIATSSDPAPKHTHCTLELTDNQQLRYIDPRRFGILSLLTDTLEAHPYIAKLGPEYDDPTLTPEHYITRCRRHQRLNIKAALLHQGIVPGLGNIYACEALYLAKVDPRRLVGDLTDSELCTIFSALRTTLDNGIRYGGTTLKDYVNGLGHRGEMQSMLQVYDREGQTTLDGCAEVIRIVQNGRSTWFAPEIQR